MITVKTIPKKYINQIQTNITNKPKTIFKKQPTTYLSKIIENNCKGIDTSSESESDSTKTASFATKETNRNWAKGQYEKDQQIFQLQREIRQNSTLNDNQQNSPTQKFSIIIQKFHQLLHFYIQEQIIKHYCSKTQWHFETKLIQSHVLPTLDLLSIKKEHVKLRFQPFLKNVTDKYLLKTELDLYSRLSSSKLLIEITYVWLKIKQAQISLKKEIRANIEDFKKIFCQENSFKIDKTKVYHVLFQNSKDLKMVNVIKLYMFLFRIQKKQNQYRIDHWIRQY